MNSKTAIIIQREYLERVKKKSFIITTLLMPIFMLALMVVPALIMEYSEPESRRLVVVDHSGIIAGQLTDDGTYRIVTDSAGDWHKMIEDDQADAVLIIPEEIGESNAPLQLYTAGPSSMLLETDLKDQVDKIIEQKRLESYNIADLDAIISSVKSDVGLRSQQYDNDTESSTMLSYALGMLLTFILYMCLLLYGQMVMTSIIEEKSNRVLELVVSSVKPMQIMLGKICGICLVAVTQILIWAGLMALMSAFLLPALIPAETMTEVAAMQAGNTQAIGGDVAVLQALSVLSNVGYILRLFGLLLLFLIGGFVLYAAIYAAIGSAVDNIQDAGQMQSFVIFPVILGIVFGMTAASDPMSSLSVWMSMIPFTSPMVMMARIPYDIPGWQIAVSLVILYASFFGMVWLAGKIYRVGIFMYGKKPTVKELIRWTRYK
ncbi:MAG: ABC transporter permease [Bacteroides sp.]|nr:ABC transporter permease [Bacteroides sp.]MCM1413333.1 ABC transporter permease [Bacteroides sp.]MCM1471981.1 ABC transporter permease [Bacteroides sp.]